MTPRIRLPFAALVAASVVALAGCAPAQAQAAAEGCDIVRSGMETLRSDLSDATAGLATGDVSGFGDVLVAIEGKLDELAPQVSNAELSSVLDDMRGGIGSFLDAVEAADNILQLAESEEFASASAQIEQAGKDLSAICD